MHIGRVVLDNRTILAPLAGITNLPMRLIARQAGCALVCSEMISANALVFGSRKTIRMLDSTPAEKPLSVQIFGSDAAVMAEAAVIVESSGADILDINFGCSVKKVVKTGAGVALMREPEQAEKMLTAVRRAIRIPLTIKIRKGWDGTGSQAVAIATIAESCGVDAIAVHPRTAGQGFRGRADWSIISAVKKKVGVPVIGNGDIVTAADAVSMIGETGCDAVMIGRAAIGNPVIFSQVRAAIEKWPPPSYELADRFRTMEQYLCASVEYLGETQACRMMRSRLGWFVKGLPHSGRFREAIKTITGRSQGLDLIRAYHCTLVEMDFVPTAAMAVCDL
jgi:tRNA-dihydrouridine synthase B